MSYYPLHFAPHELLPGLSGLETWGSLDPVLRAKLDERMLQMADEYRDLIWEWFHEYTYINDYANGGLRVASGWRPSDTKVGRPLSKHKSGEAIDAHHDMIDLARKVAKAKARDLGCNSLQVEKAGHEAAVAAADRIRAKIREWVAQGRLRYLGGMERGVPWIHLDSRARVNGKVVEFDA